MTVFCLASAFSTKTVQTKQNDYLLFNKAYPHITHNGIKRISTAVRYYSAAVPDLMVYVDYRFLHLYLTAHACADAVTAYHNVSYDAARPHNMIMDDANRYQRLFKEGKVAFDYSDFYRDALLKDKHCYSTVSHPNNKHLSIFFSAIFFDLFKENKNFDLGGNDLLKNYIAPEVGSGEQHYFMMRETGLSLACKINYHFFSSQPREQLSEALLRSTYYRSGFVE